ncbi:alpha/beta fold hydrolase [Candidatus Poribacteria bacterium]|nr:alpha/beta fold hydrolase [Candidatus Poribacteria bacterium]
MNLILLAILVINAAENHPIPLNELKSQVEERYVNVDGYRIRYLHAGQGDPMVLLHGLGVFAESWLYNIPVLAKRFSVYAPDLIGFGRSDKPRIKYDVETFDAFLLGFLNTLGIKRAVLIGNSLGGGIALYFALSHPDRVEKLVLVDPALIGRDVSWGLRILSIPLLGRVLIGKGSKEELRRALSSSFYDPKFLTDDWVEEAYRISKLPGIKHPFLSVIRNGVSLWGIKRRYVLINRLHELSMPVLIVWGEEDRVISVRYAYAAYHRIKNAKLIIFEGCGHAPQIERYTQFNKAVLEFLQAGG